MWCSEYSLSGKREHAVTRKQCAHTLRTCNHLPTATEIFPLRLPMPFLPPPPHTHTHTDTHTHICTRTPRAHRTLTYTGLNIHRHTDTQTHTHTHTPSGRVMSLESLVELLQSLEEGPCVHTAGPRPRRVLHSADDGIAVPGVRVFGRVCVCASMSCHIGCRTDGDLRKLSARPSATISRSKV